MDLRSRTRILELIIIAAMLLVVAPFAMAGPDRNISINLINQTTGNLEVGEQLNISANVTVNGSEQTRDVVSLNITAPNGSPFLLTMTNHSSADNSNHSIFNVSFVIPLHFRPGNYTFQIVANTSSIAENVINASAGNLSFFLNGTVNVTTVNMTQPNPRQGNLVNITVNVSSLVDGAGFIDTVLANITPPNGTASAYTLVMTNGSNGGMTFNVSFITTEQDTEGRYDVTIIANDTANKVNNTITTEFNVTDLSPPKVDNSNVTQIAGPGQGNLVNVSVNVSDNLVSARTVDVVLAQITPPNGSGNAYNYTMTNGSQGGTTFNVSFIIPFIDGGGLYNVTFLANDTGNYSDNINNTIYTEFLIQTAPNVTTLNVTQPGGSIQGTLVNITVNATDIVGSGQQLDKVLVNITPPNGSASTYTRNMTNGSDGGDTYNFSFVTNQYDAAGTYTVLIVANDSGNANNDTITVTYAVTDTTEPNVTVLNLSPDVLSANLSVPVNITVNITDNVDDTSRVDTVRVNVTINDSLSRIYTLTNGTGNTYNVTVLLPVSDGVGVKNFTILANDTSGNLNDSIKLNFTFDDNTPPNVTDISIPSSDDPLPGEVIMIQAVVADNSLVDRVFANITIAGGVTEQQQIELFLQDGTTTIYNNTFANTSTDGSYNIRITANDTYIATPEFTKITGNTNASINISLAINALTPSTGTGGSAGGGGGGGGAIRRAQNVGTLNPLGTQTVVKARQPITFLSNGKSYKLEVATIFSKSVVVRIFTRPEQRYSVAEGQTVHLDIDGGGPDFSVTYDARSSNLITLTLAPFADSPVLRDSVATPLESISAPQLVDETEEVTEDLATGVEGSGDGASSGVSSEGAADTVGSSGGSSTGLKGLAVLLVLGVIAVGAYLYNRDGGLKGWKPAYAGSVSEGHKEKFKSLIDKVRK
ncbi:hypothetical protein CMO91_06605 [Candidatus Woesearchaeota archaeon]|nr:hypothetical protein [Candidatus Woesearchaeota archaeon]